MPDVPAYVRPLALTVFEAAPEFAQLAPSRTRAVARVPVLDDARPETGRVRFVAAAARATAAHAREIMVELASPTGDRGVATAHVVPSALGELHAAAIAALGALDQALGTPPRFVLRGIKCVRAFDETLVLVRLSGSTAHVPTRLVGVAVVDDEDMVQAAVFAVLNATNRAVGAARNARG